MPSYHLRMTELALHRATYEDLLNVPDNLVGELIDGELYTSPRPAPRHANVTSMLGGDLNARFQRGRGGPGGWWILSEVEEIGRASCRERVSFLV